MKTIPTENDVDRTPDAGAVPKTLCANWTRGCNGVTDGPDADGLTLCEECGARSALEMSRSLEEAGQFAEASVWRREADALQDQALRASGRIERRP
jgi:hypothetical protein